MSLCLGGLTDKKSRGASHDGPLVVKWNIKLYIDTLSYQYKNMCRAKLRKKCTICDRLSHFFLSACLPSWRRVLRAPKKQRSVSRRTSETMKTDMTVSHIKIIMSKNLLSLQSYNKIIPYALIFGGIFFHPPSGADKRRVRRVSAKKMQRSVSRRTSAT